MATANSSYDGDSICLHIQNRIDELKAAKYYTQSDKGVTDFLISPENKADFAQFMTEDKGKIPNPSHLGRVFIESYPQECDFTNASAIARCTLPSAGDAPAERTVKEVWADLRTTFTIAINRDGYRDTCYTAEDAKRDIIMAKKDAVLKDIENKLLAALAGTLGGYKNQNGTSVTSVTNPLSLRILNDNGQINPSAIGIAKQQFKKKNIKQDVHFFAGNGSLMQMGIDNLIFAIGNTSTGTDVTKPNLKYHISEDLNEDTTLAAAASGAAKILGVPTGTYQVITWNGFVDKYEESFRDSGFRWEKSTVDLWGFKWDVMATRDVCYDYMQFELKYGLIQYIPDTLGCADHRGLMFVEACGNDDCSSIADAVAA